MPLYYILIQFSAMNLKHSTQVIILQANNNDKLDR